MASDTNVPWLIYKGIRTLTPTAPQGTPHCRNTPADLHSDTQSHSQMLHTYPQGHNCPQTHMFPDKPPPTGVRTSQHRRPHLHIHFLTGILPPSCTTPGGIIHIARFLNGAPWSPFSSGALVTQGTGSMNILNFFFFFYLGDSPKEFKSDILYKSRLNLILWHVCIFSQKP